MVDPARLAGLLSRVADERRELGRLAALDDAELVADPDRLPAMKYRFVVAIEALTDAGQHVIASEGWAPPTSYAQVFTRLAEHGILDAELADRLSGMTGFRNLLVHRYAAVDDRRVIEIARTRLDDLDAARAAIAALV